VDDEKWREETTKQRNSHRAIPNSTPDETGEEPSELPPPVLKGEGTPKPRPLTLPPMPLGYTDNVGFFNPETTPNSGATSLLFL
jgi:hypothetical protein